MQKHDLSKKNLVYIVTLIEVARLCVTAFGMGSLCSHGMERTHVKAIEETAKCIIGYVLDL